MRTLLFLALSLASVPVAAKSVTELVEWDVDGVTYQGYLVYEDSGDGATKRPGLVMFPNWMGVTEDAVMRAKDIADDDYVVLVADMYGKGVRPANPAEAGKLSGAVSGDRPALRRRAAAALDVLRRSDGEAPLDERRLAAIGFCFGGAVALDLARAGGDIAGAVSFHGNLATPLPAQSGVIKAPVLVLNGAADTFVSQESIAAFKSEMTAAGADWQFVDFGGAVHCFAEPTADGVAIPGCKYDERASDRAYAMMSDFLTDRFADD